jgi:hypothetical protein
LKIEDFAVIIQVPLRIRQRINKDIPPWLCSFERGEIKQGCMLSGIYGDGSTPDEAIRDYARQVKGQILIVGAATQNRREYFVPESIE